MIEMNIFSVNPLQEYSVENVLATIELQQFQNHYQGKLRDKRWSKSFKPSQLSKLEMSPDLSPDSLGMVGFPDFNSTLYFID